MPPVDRRNPIRAASSESTCSLLEFAREFPDDEACLIWLWRERFAADGEHAHCSSCDTERVFKRYDTAQKRPSGFAERAGYRIHPMKGTIYESSSTSLQLWFYALYFMASTRCGISAKQLERELGVNYKTAWRMFNMIRNELMIQDDDAVVRRSGSRRNFRWREAAPVRTKRPLPTGNRAAAWAQLPQARHRLRSCRAPWTCRR